jgi:hypothetical protein
MEELPERLLPESDVQAPQGGDLVLGEGLGAVRRCRPPLDTDRRVPGDPALALPPAIALRAMDSSRLTVSASISSARAAASSARASGSAGSSIAATGKTGSFAPRRAGPVGAGSPASIHPHVVSEIR